MVKLNTLSSKALRRTKKELAEVLDLAKGKLLVEVTCLLYTSDAADDC